MKKTLFANKFSISIIRYVSVSGSTYMIISSHFLPKYSSSICRESSQVNIHRRQVEYIFSVIGRQSKLFVEQIRKLGGTDSNHVPGNRVFWSPFSSSAYLTPLHNITLSLSYIHTNFATHLVSTTLSSCSSLVNSIRCESSLAGARRGSSWVTSNIAAVAMRAWAILCDGLLAFVVCALSWRSDRECKLLLAPW